jgi:hypothetical protein
LFIVFNVNNENKDINVDSVLFLYNELKIYTSNFDILLITNYKSKQQSYKYNIYNNVHKNTIIFI